MLSGEEWLGFLAAAVTNHAYSQAALLIEGLTQMHPVVVVATEI